MAMKRGTTRETKNEVFSLLSNQRRRYALHACKDSDSPLDVSEVAEKVAAWEYDKARNELGSDERKRVYTAMQQTHLPAMEEAGAIEFDGKEVELTERAKEMEVYLDIVQNNSLSWGDYYLGLSLISALVLVGAYFGIYPESIPDIFWAVSTVAVFGLSSAYHSYRSRKRRLGETEKPPEEW